jgi:hypothetical protein
MKLIDIIRESSNISNDIGESAAVGKLFKTLLSGFGDLTIAGLKNSNDLRLITLSDDVLKVFNAKNITGRGTADDVVRSLAKGSLKTNALGDFAVGVMKTKDVSATQIRALAPEFVNMPFFIQKYAKDGNKLTRAGLKKSGYTDIAITEILNSSKNSVKFQNALKGVSKTKPKVNPTSATGLRKVYNDVVSYLKGNPKVAKVTAGLPKSSRTVRLLKWVGKTTLNVGVGAFKLVFSKWLIILGIGGYIAWNWSEWFKDGGGEELDGYDFTPETNFLKCILIPLGDDEGVKIESDGKGNPVLYYTKGSSYDGQGGLVFRVDGSVETGDGSKKGTWTCNTSGLDLQEQSTGNDITTKELSGIITDLNDNLMGDWFDGDSTDMKDTLNIIKRLKDRTYTNSSGKTGSAINTIITNYPKLHGNSLRTDIDNLTNLDFEGIETKNELLNTLGLSSGKSSGGNKSGDSDVKGDGNTSTGISHITIKWASGGSGGTAPVVGTVKYVQCTDLPFKYGCISDKIKNIQNCLPAELKPDGYYGPKTSNALWNLYQGNEKSDITKVVYDKVMGTCNKKNEKSTEPRPKVEPISKLEPKGLAPLKIYDTDAVMAKIDPEKMKSDIQKTIDGRRIDGIIANDLEYSAGRYVLKVDDELTDNQLKIINLYMASKGFKALRKKRETLDGGKYIWKPDSKDTKRIARQEKSIKRKENKIDNIKNKDDE